MPSSRLAITLCGIPLSTPILAASGTFAYGVEFDGLVDWDGVGGFVTKGLSREPIAGNPPPRVWETEAGMINSIGLQNMGVRAFIEGKLPAVRQLPSCAIANIFGDTIEDYVEVVGALEAAGGMAAYELNASCPNTQRGGMLYSSDPALLSELTSAVRAVTRRPLWVKLSPNVARIEPIARAAEDAGADAVSLVNTFVALSIDVRTREPHIGAGYGGLSGPAIKPIALRMVHEAAQAVRIPVIGLGGVASGLDAAEFLIAGAAAVQVGTAHFWDPNACARIATELDRFLQEEGIALVSSLTGSLRWRDRRT